MLMQPRRSQMVPNAWRTTRDSAPITLTAFLVTPKSVISRCLARTQTHSFTTNFPINQSSSSTQEEVSLKPWRAARLAKPCQLQLWTTLDNSRWVELQNIGTLSTLPTTMKRLMQTTSSRKDQSGLYLDKLTLQREAFSNLSTPDRWELTDITQEINLITSLPNFLAIKTNSTSELPKLPPIFQATLVLFQRLISIARLLNNPKSYNPAKLLSSRTS